ncbi:MAG: hypothetical protein U0Q14_06420 [Dermatophilaceae bacterium]
MTRQAPRPSGVRFATVVVGTMALAGTILWWFARLAWSGWQSLHSDAPASPSDLLVSASAALGVVVLLWLVVAVLATTASMAPGRGGVRADRLATAIAPAALRRLVAVVLGVGLSTGLASGGAFADGVGLSGPGVTATATNAPTESAPAAGSGPTLTAARPGSAHLPPPSDGSQVGTVGSDALGSAQSATAATSVVPDPALAPTRSLHGLGPLSRPTRSPATAPQVVVVVAGDCLWDIAARHLGPGATDAQIAAEWPRWYAANRHLIGDDPDLIQIGLHLQAPTEEHS